jgi:hypothetical protein
MDYAFARVGSWVLWCCPPLAHRRWRQFTRDFDLRTGAINHICLADHRHSIRHRRRLWIARKFAHCDLADFCFCRRFNLASVHTPVDNPFVSPFRVIVHDGCFVEDNVYLLPGQRTCGHSVIRKMRRGNEREMA